MRGSEAPAPECYDWGRYIVRAPKRGVEELKDGKKPLDQGTSNKTQDEVHHQLQLAKPGVDFPQQRFEGIFHRLQRAPLIPILYLCSNKRL